MTGRFKGFENIADTLKGFKMPEIKAPSFTIPETKAPSFTMPDKRSRAERREDFESELEKLDKKALIDLKNTIQEIDDYSEAYENNFWSHKEEIENSLIKFVRYIEKFEEVNSEITKQVSLKRQELKLEARHDWAEKSRLFFFRVLASALLICTLFSIGYIEKEYDWATLPLSKYVRPIPLPVEKPTNTKNTNTLELIGTEKTKAKGELKVKLPKAEHIILNTNTIEKAPNKKVKRDK